MATTMGEVWQLLDSRTFGGIETHVEHLCHGLFQAGFKTRVLLLNRYGDHPLVGRLRQASVPVEALNGTGALASLMRSRRPNLLHTHGYKAGIIGRVLARTMSVPVVSTFHNGDLGTGRIRLYTEIDRLTGPLSHQIAVSASIGARIFGNHDVIENFVPLERSRDTAGDPRSIAFAGRLSFEKGPDLFCRLAESLPEFTCHVYGDGPMRADLQEQYGKVVEFHGQRDGLDQTWPEVGLLCITSRAEGLPLVALEAMAASVPVASFDVGAMSQLINHRCDGWIASAGDIKQIADHVRKHFAASTAVRKQMKSRARKRIEEQFSMKSQVPKILEVYRKAATNSV